MLMTVKFQVYFFKNFSSKKFKMLLWPLPIALSMMVTTSALIADPTIGLAISF